MTRETRRSGDALAESSRYDKKLSTLEMCEREPIHFIGHVQPHAIMVVCVRRDDDYTIEYVSENVEEHLGVSQQTLLSAPLSRLLDVPQLNAMQASASDERRFYSPSTFKVTTSTGVRTLQGAYHEYEGKLFVEFEAFGTEHYKTSDLLLSEGRALNQILGLSNDVESIGEFAQGIAGYFRELLSYDRVMVYRFADDDHGEVIAESKLDHLESFLGMNYPASDIPRVARQLYVLNRCRIICNVAATPVPLVAANPGASAESLDLRYSNTRAISPIHLEYLGNMGVAATLTMSLVENDHLWGMVIFHNYEPRYCTPRARALVHELSHLCSSMLNVIHEREASRLQRLNTDLEHLIFLSLQKDDSYGSLAKASPAIRHLVEADGLIIKFADCPAIADGIVPDSDAFERLLKETPEIRSAEHLSCKSLPSDFPEIHALNPEIAGMHFYMIAGDIRSYIAWFRVEKVRKVKWAGRKDEYNPDRDGRLHPRRSFKLWKETVRGESIPWGPRETFATRQLRAMLLRLELRMRDAQLAHLGHYDSLTQLPNRNLFLQHLNARIESAHVRGQGFSLLFIDFDRFKNINDSLGHDMGDDVLVQLARRLQEFCDNHVFVARLGGDEFTVLVEDAHERSVDSLAKDIVNAFRSPISVREHSFYLPISVGVSSYETGKSQEEMMRDADTAMYDAKAKGGNRFSISSQQIRTDARARLDLEQSLHKAVDRGEIKTYYQPIVSARSGDVYALEALIRWQRPSGMVPPGHFLAIAEATGLIVPLGNELIRQTLRFARTLNNRGRTGLKFNINLSAVQLLDDSTYDTLFQEIEANAVPYSQICLEVTEQSQIVDEERIVNRLSDLRELGILVALDDFGAGYSSISYLQSLPLDIVKFDRAFLLSLRTQSGPVKMLQACRSLAQACNLLSIVEGVEEEEEQRVLDGIGFEYYQGFHFSRPTSPEDMLAYLDARTPRLIESSSKSAALVM